MGSPTGSPFPIRRAVEGQADAPPYHHPDVPSKAAVPAS